MPAELAFGITAGSRPDHPRLGAELERLGYAELWTNDTRRGDGIATLADVATGTTTLRLGVGVVALSEHGPAAIRDRVSTSSLPADRFVLGVGSGSSASLDRVRSGVAELRRLLPETTPIAVAAVGPRMARLAGEIADVVVANWALPDRLSWVRERVDEGAAAGRRDPPRFVAYVRTAIGPGADARLLAEMDRYRGYGAGHYARAFDAQPDLAVGVAVERPDAAAMAVALAPYRDVVDTLVVRALPVENSVEGWLEIARLAADG